MSDLRRLVVTAAHAGISPGAVPIGGGASVVGQLAAHWAAAGLPVTVLGLGAEFGVPGVVYEQVPVRWPRDWGPDDLVRLGELDYARVCRDFEREVTARVRREDPRGLVVVANDISEGPDFAALDAAGLPVVTLWHVDVVDYFARFYLGGLAPETAVAFYLRLGAGRRLVPDVLKLVFAKQTACVAHSRRHVVPSSPMRAVIDRCYPGAGAKVEVVPWGAWPTVATAAEVAAAREALRREHDLRPGETLLVTLSRLSPEKGLERLLRALALGEARRELPAGVRLWIGGEAAFMQGQRYVRHLQRLAGRLRRVRVDFLGYVAGARKLALWELADLYVFPSRHESYGLTLAEALRSGVPVVTTEHYSARDLVPPGVGVIVPNRPEAQVPAALWEALRPLLGDAARRAALAQAAAAVSPPDFASAAARVAAICAAVLTSPAGRDPAPAP